MSQVQKKRKIIEYSQDEDFFNDDLLEKLYQSEYQPDQTMSDYSPEDLTMSSAIEGFEPLKFSVFGNRAETDKKEQARLKKYEKTYGKEGAKVRNRIFKRILGKKQDGTKAGQWSARKAQSLAEDYEKAMSGKGKKPYKSSKRTKSQKSLKKWGDQDWKTKSGKKSSKTGERYLPAKAIEALSDKEYKKTSDKKRKDSKKGKQFSDQPKKIADKVAKYRAESKKPSSVEISRSSNPEKKLMAVFEDSEGKKTKTTHFGQRGASDYPKHGEKERMERYLERHGGGFETSTKENWKDPTTAGSLSRWVLWNKPGLKSSFSDYKRRFGLKGDITVSKSAEIILGQPQTNTHAVAVIVPDPKQKVEGVVRFTQDGKTLHVDYDIENLDDGEHGFHVHEYGDLTDGCKSACAHFNPHSEEHGGLDSQTRHLGDLGNIVSKDGVSKGRISTDSISLNMGLPNCIVGRMIIVHKDRDDLGKGGDAESLLTGNAGKRLGCGVIGLSEGKDFDAEDWEDSVQWEDKPPSIDPSPFEEVEWKELPPPPPAISRLMKGFQAKGYSILVVGGAVRDLLLGLEPKDYDLATDATPDEVEEVVKGLEGYRYVLGPQAEKSRLNLTSLVTVPNEKEAVEITTYRKELGYAGDRTKGEFIPAQTFTEDSSRRDLTINAMGMTVDGIVIDPQGGLTDLQEGVIRAVGDPTQRFVEDPLRMIRAIRFSVRFGLPIEDETYDAIVANADLIPTLSGRRLRDEIGKVLIEPNGYKLLMETGILPTLMPQFRNMEQYHHKLDYHPEDTLYNHYIEVFKKFTMIPNRTELGAWALLFHDIAKPQTAEWDEQGWHTFYGHDKQGAQLVLDNYNNQDGPFEFSKKELQAIAWTTDHHLGKFWEMKKPMKVSAMRNNENFPLLVEVITGDTMGIRRGGDEQLRKRLVEIDEITNKVNEQKAKTGNRPPGFAKQVIQTLNVQGKQISEALTEIEEMVSTGQVQSYDEALEVLKTKRNA